jgi:hypothetical protein
MWKDPAEETTAITKHRLNARTSSSLQIPRATKIPRILVARRIQQRQEQATITIQKQEEKRIQIYKKSC